MRRWLTALLACWCACAAASAIPPQAHEHFQQLRGAIDSIWPDAPLQSFMPAQMEQESCVSLKNPRCWNSRVELKTAREYGFGIPQFTVAYYPDGRVRFNKWLELRLKYRDALAAWTWDNRFDARLQFVAYVETMRSLWRQFSFVPDVFERLAFSLSSYNGGAGAAMQDRILCRNTPGCDQNRWFDNVERTSMKSRVPFKGYGKSAFDINREYPRNVLYVRRSKYEQFFSQGSTDGSGR